MNEQTLTLPIKRDIIFDSAALAFIGLAPAFAHFASLPLYMIEPMRLVLILALVHTAELLANTGLFLFLIRRGAYPFLAMFLSILVSKAFCYSLYMLLFPWSFVVAEAQTGFLLIQGAVTILLASYAAVVLMKR
jgi:hypothetical protein